MYYINLTILYRYFIVYGVIKVTHSVCVIFIDKRAKFLYYVYAVILPNRVLMPLGKGSVAFSLTGFISRGSNFWYFSSFFFSHDAIAATAKEINTNLINCGEKYDERGNVIKYKGWKRRLGVLFADRYIYLFLPRILSLKRGRNKIKNFLLFKFKYRCSRSVFYLYPLINNIGVDPEPEKHFQEIKFPKLYPIATCLSMIQQITF